MHSMRGKISFHRCWPDDPTNNWCLYCSSSTILLPTCPPTDIMHVNPGRRTSMHHTCSPKQRKPQATRQLTPERSPSKSPKGKIPPHWTIATAATTTTSQTTTHIFPWSIPINLHQSRASHLLACPSPLPHTRHGLIHQIPSNIKRPTTHPSQMLTTTTTCMSLLSLQLFASVAPTVPLRLTIRSLLFPSNSLTRTISGSVETHAPVI